MDKSCKREDNSCGNNCEQTRRQVAKIMAGFGLVITGLVWYILREDLLKQFF